MDGTDENTFHKIGFGLLAAAALLFGLFVNGALPGFMAPTTGQAIWTLGFAQSFVNGSSIYATNFGLPNPAAISFGLAGALPPALFLKIGIPPADAYSLAFALWLTVAFYGAYRFVRLLGAELVISLMCATLWLTLPVIWQHSDYSMVSLGIALLPAYFYSALRLVRYECDVSSIVLFFGATLSSVFMDGYSFMMFASGTAVLLMFAFGLGWVGRLELLLKRGPIIAFSFAISYLLYAKYIGKSAFIGEDIDFFRAYGSNIEFFLRPTQGLLWLPDLLGLSVDRQEADYFGDGSVATCSFALLLIIIATYSLVTKSTSRELKWTFLLVALCGFYMALGPSFKWDVLKPAGEGTYMPLQYAPWRTGTEFLSLYLPGFNNMRASYRWVALGLFGAWALLALHVASRRAQSRITIALILVGIACNIPTPAGITANVDSRKAIIEIDDYVESLKSVFRPGETVAFLPFRNDFLANYMASRLDIRTYNVGGDKNLIDAMVSWPDAMLVFEMGKAGPDFGKNVMRLLAKKQADVAVVPYIDMLLAANQWPFPLQYSVEMQPYLDDIQSSGLVDITRTNNFAFIRLKPDLRQLSSEQLSKFAPMHGCKQDVPLALLSPLRFSDASSVCGNGWSSVETWGRWTMGRRATLHYQLPYSDEGNVLEFDVQGFVGGNLDDQKIKVSVNDEKSVEWDFTVQVPRRIERLELPQGLKNLKIKFDMADAQSPKIAGVSDDLRTLGLGVVSVCLTTLNKPCLRF